MRPNELTPYNLQQLRLYARGLTPYVLEHLWTSKQGRVHNKLLRLGLIEWNGNEWVISEAGREAI